MSIFGSILGKIFHHDAAAAPAPEASTPQAGSPAPGMAPPADPFGGAGAGAPAAQPAGTPAQPVDVGAVLTKMAAGKGGGGNYETSIVDLLKLLDLDSGLDARKGLANELSVHAGADGSAEQNVALHKAVMAKLAENGGTVPASMRG